MKKELEDIFAAIKNGNTQYNIHDLISESALGYIDDDWEDEFESEDEAYEETGRGEAEADVLQNLVFDHGGQNLEINDHCTLIDALKEHYDIITD